MAKKLPTIMYRKRKHIVDFKLGELRDAETANPIKFTDMPEEKNSTIKKKLRGLRFRTWGQEYMAGLDD